MRKLFFLPLFICLVCLACNSNTSEKQEAKTTASKALSSKSDTPVSSKSKPDNKDLNTSFADIDSPFPWLKTYNEADALEKQLPPPTGFKRIAVKENSFGDWLRNLPLKPEGTPVFLHKKSRKRNQNAHYRVINLDTGERDLQQCADALMRLKSEYLYSQKEYSKIHFNYTSGDKVSFDDWRFGSKPIVKGNSVNFSAKGSEANNSYANFRKYMNSIFTYAGTMSLTMEMKKIALESISVGDAFIVGGSPGHAVLVMDVVENDAGEKRFLLAQSFMPAQDMHILKQPGSASPWYSANFEGDLITPEWRFTAKQLKRF